jgi:hypothetical protein
MGGYEMGTASNIKKHEIVTEAPREYPTEWTWYADDRPERKKNEQMPRESRRRIEEEAMMIQGYFY